MEYSMTSKREPKNGITPKFNVGDKVFVCDGEEYHGKIVTIINVYPDDDRYDASIGNEKQCGWNHPFRFAKEKKFCAIEKGICELCGSSEGIVKPQYPEKEFGDVHDLAVRKFPYAVTCICPACQKLFDLREEKRQQMVKLRTEFRDAEYTRRKKNNLCEKCGGVVHHSKPCLVYEGTYEVTYHCSQCGKTGCFT
jgi:hypothetical protein